MENNKHTQGKWNNDFYCVRDSNGNIISECDFRDSAKESEANAKLIVKAVNSHYKLIEALKNICEAQGNGIEKEFEAYDKAQSLLQSIEQQ